MANRVAVLTPSTGVGNLTVGSALPTFVTPAQAGVPNGAMETWLINEGADFEILKATYSSAGPTINRGAGTVLLSLIGGTPGTAKMNIVGSAQVRIVPASEDVRAFEMVLAASDETTDLTTGTAKTTFRMPVAVRLLAVRASLSNPSSSGLVTVDIMQGGVTILSTKITINVGAKTSVGATTPAVISVPNLTNDAEITINVDVAGTGAKGLKVALLGLRS